MHELLIDSCGFDRVCAAGAAVIPAQVEDRRLQWGAIRASQRLRRLSESAIEDCLARRDGHPLIGRLHEFDQPSDCGASVLLSHLPNLAFYLRPTAGVSRLALLKAA